MGVLVLIYIDNLLIVGRGKGRVRGQAMRAVQGLRAAGGIIGPKSTLELVTRLVWLGKDVDLSGGSLPGNAWEALLAHWLRLSVGVGSVRRLQQFLGRAQWICRPRFGHSPHLAGVWAHVLCPPPPLVCSLPRSSGCALCAWRVCWLCRVGRTSLCRERCVESFCLCMLMRRSTVGCRSRGFFRWSWVRGQRCPLSSRRSSNARRHVLSCRRPRGTSLC